MRASIFRKKFLTKDSMCGVENDISLCIVYKTITIVFIFNEYYQFRIWHKFIGTNFTGEKYIGSMAKDTEVQCFGFITQEDLLRYFLFEMLNKCVIVYISYSYNYKFLPGIW